MAFLRARKTVTPRSFSVLVHGGRLKVSPGFHIRYLPANPDGCPLWTKSISGPSSVSLTFIRSPSGAGKSTLLKHVHARLAEHKQMDLAMDFQPDYDDTVHASVGFVPQAPATTSHWRVASLLPPQSVFLPSFFSQDQIPKLLLKHLGELSGGECRRLYACSALERLVHHAADTCFLLLDETFDGVGMEAMTDMIPAVCNIWSANATCPLHLLVVTHFDIQNSPLASPQNTVLHFDIHTRTDDEMLVKVTTQ